MKLSSSGGALQQQHEDAHPVTPSLSVLAASTHALNRDALRLLRA